MIQLFARTSDLISSEKVVSNGKFFLELLESVYEEGIKDALNIKPDGYVIRGNTRVRVAESLDIEYVPINLKAFLGLFLNLDATYLRIRKSVVEYMKSKKENFDEFDRECIPVIPAKKEKEVDYNWPLKSDDSFYYYKLETEALLNPNYPL